MDVDNTVLDDAELRDLVIDLLRAQTERDKQRALGASDLANQCDRCLAMKFAGVERSEPIQSARLWMGAVLGTSIHGEIEHRIQKHSSDIESPLFDRVSRTWPEMRHPICKIEGYGTIYGTIDWSLPRQIVDWKGTTRKKLALLRDFLALMQGQPPIFGRQHRLIKLSEKEYAEQMEAQVHKMNAYFAQVTLYSYARAQAGRPVEKGSIVWIARDGNGYFDLPYGDRYNDEKATHDIWVTSFDYSEAAALQIIERAQGIFNDVQAGRPFDTFDQAPGCWTCSQEEKEAAEAELLSATPETITFGNQTVAA